MAPASTGEAKNLKVYPGCVLGRGLFEDSAIEERDADDLDRTSFAVRIAQLCSDVAQESESSVIAVIGAWGSGKSSLLSLVDHELSHTDALDWTVIRFSPWLFSDLDTLLREFFAAISHAMGTDRGAELRKKISGYVDGISPLGKFGSLVGVDASSAVSPAKVANRDRREPLGEFSLALTEPAESCRTTPESNALFEYLEIFHNRRRRHSALGMLSPIEYEMLHRTQPVA